MVHHKHLLTVVSLLSLSIFACNAFNGIQATAPSPTVSPALPTLSPTSLPPIPVPPGESHPNEPVFITGDIPYTSPFFINTISEPFVLLEDQAGFVHRDKDFEFRLSSQVIGPVEIHDDKTLTYSLALPSIPQGTQVDVDNDGERDAGVQIFAIAYWSNTWNGPFLEERDGRGWSNAYVSTITDPEQDDEIIGGILVVWAPDDQQGFPTDFGADGKLFTNDDPTAPIPAGYNLVDLNQRPFRVYKEVRPHITLNEGEISVNDFSKMSYTQAFEALFEKVSREYPFTEEKKIDWDSLRNKYAARIARVSNDKDFYRALRDFTWEIPDAHVGISANGEVFFEENGGSFGINLAELSDGRVIVTRIFPDTPAERAGLQVGAEIISWDDKPIQKAIEEVIPFFGPFSTPHHKRLEQVIFLTRVPPGTRVDLTYRNPGGQEKHVTLKAEVEYDSLFAAIPEFSKDELVIPIEGEVLDETGLGYLRINTFSADYSLMARLWEHFIKRLVDNEIQGLIIDLRTNSGGSGKIAFDFAGYFFEEEMPLYYSLYYNDLSGKFEREDLPVRVEPAPLIYKGPIAVLVSPYCISACEGFAYALTQQGRSIIVGHFPTAGAFGEVGRGQYTLPGGISMQFPTGRPETPEGQLLIEGVGVTPDITVPITEDSVLGGEDTVLKAAIEALLKKIK